MNDKNTFRTVWLLLALAVMLLLVANDLLSDPPNIPPEPPTNLVVK